MLEWGEERKKKIIQPTVIVIWDGMDFNYRGIFWHDRSNKALRIAAAVKVYTGWLKVNVVANKY